MTKRGEDLFENILEKLGSEFDFIKPILRASFHHEHTMVRGEDGNTYCSKCVKMISEAMRKEVHERFHRAMKGHTN